MSQQKQKLVCALYCVHDDSTFLSASLRSTSSVPRIVLVSRVNWVGREGEYKPCEEIACSEGAEVVLGDWPDEKCHREAALEAARARGFRYALTLDSDEVMEPGLLASLVKVAKGDLADRVYATWDTYWKDCEHVIRPREPFTPCVMVNLAKVVHGQIRDYCGGAPLFLGSDYGIIHHLSYAGTDERIWRKISTWSHRDEVVPGWWQGVWKGWEANPLLRNLHPTAPHHYGMAERIEFPEIFSLVGLQRSGGKTDSSCPFRCSIVVPAFGQQEALDDCLASLEKCGELIQEIVVVDDASPQTLRVRNGVKCVRNSTNLGFAGACNAGYRLTSSDVIIFLNSDTVVPKKGLEMLLNSIHSEGSIAAAGPCSGCVGHLQLVEPTYTDLARLDLFAEDFACRDEVDQDVDMLVGFCLAVKRSALSEVGPFDTRFGRGMFEDNDLCYRLRRAGYRLVISSRAFVHHVGSKTFQASNVDAVELLRKNRGVYLSKWKDDIESGFATHLSGLSQVTIQFNSALKPERRIAEIKGASQRADISLCMIVKNEERVLRDCLESVKPFVREMLVLDTGSDDQTIDIARQCGAIVRESSWEQSFSRARTQSMKFAKGKWILWMDADDTMPLKSGETIVRAVASAAADISGFVVPVRFLEDQGNGTEVDHVKLFRNIPGLKWQHRIHEQILGSLRSSLPNGKLVRLDAFVLHSGYDTSPEGQARKHTRDKELLELDLKDHPEHPFVHFNIGMTAHYNNEHEKAISWLNSSVALASEGESHIRKAFALIVGSLRAMERMDEALEKCQLGLLTVPGDPELLFLSAGLESRLGNHSRAIEQYLKSIKSDARGVFSSADPGIRTWKARHNLALEYRAVGNWESAKSCWLEAMESDGRAECSAALFDAALEVGDLLTARKAMDWVLVHHGKYGLWPRMITELGTSAGFDSAPILEAEIARDPTNEGARRVLGDLLMATGRQQAAVHHLDFLQARGDSRSAVVLGDLAAQQGDSSRAERWWQRAKELGYPGGRP